MLRYILVPGSELETVGAICTGQASTHSCTHVLPCRSEEQLALGDRPPHSAASAVPGGLLPAADVPVVDTEAAHHQDHVLLHHLGVREGGKCCRSVFRPDPTRCLLQLEPQATRT